jgi:hypothetical protein
MQQDDRRSLTVLLPDESHVTPGLEPQRPSPAPRRV